MRLIGIEERISKDVKFMYKGIPVDKLSYVKCDGNRSHPPPRRRSGRAAIQAAAMAGIGGEGRLARAAAMSARA